MYLCHKSNSQSIIYKLTHFSQEMEVVKTIALLSAVLHISYGLESTIADVLSTSVVPESNLISAEEATSKHECILRCKLEISCVLSSFHNKKCYLYDSVNDYNIANKSIDSSIYQIPTEFISGKKEILSGTYFEHGDIFVICWRTEQKETIVSFYKDANFHRSESLIYSNIYKKVFIPYKNGGVNYSKPYDVCLKSFNSTLVACKGNECRRYIQKVEGKFEEWRHPSRDQGPTYDSDFCMVATKHFSVKKSIIKAIDPLSIPEGEETSAATELMQRFNEFYAQRPLADKRFALIVHNVTVVDGKVQFDFIYIDGNDIQQSKSIHAIFWSYASASTKPLKKVPITLKYP